MHVHAHAGTRVHEATSLTGLVPERVQLTVHTTEPTGTVPEPFHCDHIARWSARTGTSGHSGTGLNTGNWNGSGTVLVSNLWCEHGLRPIPMIWYHYFRYGNKGGGVKLVNKIANGDEVPA